MDKFFSGAYRGDPGVPHADPYRFVNIWIGSLVFTASSCINPYYWHIGSTTFNWHDRVMLFEQYHWKRAMKKNQPYEFMWNKTWGQGPPRFILLQLACLLHLGLFLFFPLLDIVLIVTLVANLEKIDIPHPSLLYSRLWHFECAF